MVIFLCGGQVFKAFAEATVSPMSDDLVVALVVGASFLCCLCCCRCCCLKRHPPLTLRALSRAFQVRFEQQCDHNMRIKARDYLSWISRDHAK